MKSLRRGFDWHSFDFLHSALIYAVLIHRDLWNMSRNWHVSGIGYEIEPFPAPTGTLFGTFWYHPFFLSVGIMHYGLITNDDFFTLCKSYFGDFPMEYRDDLAVLWQRGW